MRIIAALAASFALVGGLAAATMPQGTITGLTLSPATAEVGTRVTATATGSTGPCGAVHIDWGDGTAITYPTEVLPYSQTHIYKAAGTYQLRAQGMGNCLGEARSRIVVTAPAPPPPPPRAPAPPPAPPAPRITGFEVTPVPDAAATAREFRILGTGRCSYTLDFGDGNTQIVDGNLPDVHRHNYPAGGRITATVTGRGPCAGVQRSTFVVARPDRAVEPPASVTRVEVRPQIARAGDPVTITVAGSGACKFGVDFGDGQSRTLTAQLPHQLTYRYKRIGNFEIFVWTHAPCSGEADAVLQVVRNR